MTTEHLETGRKRLLQVFRFLEALNQRRNPVKRQIQEQGWVMWFRELPEHSCVRRGQFASVEANNEHPGIESRSSLGDDFVLKVRRPTPTSCPVPPDQIRDWLRPGWDSPYKKAETIAYKEAIDSSGNKVKISFEDEPLRVEVIERWQNIRHGWVAKERPTRDALKAFNLIYELYGQLSREAEKLEIVLGDGILVWRRNEGGIRHPILLQSLELLFDPAIPEFTFRETEKSVELYTSLFRSLSDVDGKLIGAIRSELEVENFHPLDGPVTSGFFRSVVQRLAPDGTFVNEPVIQTETGYPQISRDPVIFVRSRASGFARAIEAILAELPEASFLPSALLNIVGIDKESQQQSFEGSVTNWANENEQVLLSKPANAEQLQIAQRLERYSSVLVQGPPGTGKTHTIANLVGHLLAQGKSVLVTSHTPKALRVVRDKIDRALQPLAVSVLGGDSESRSQLEQAVQGIVERSTTDSTQLEQESIRLWEQRKRLLQRLSGLREQLNNARNDEYREIVIGGKGYTPSDAARIVSAGLDKYDWIPGPLQAGQSLPLSREELRELYQINEFISPQDEKELQYHLPRPEDLLSPNEFGRLVTTLDRLQPNVSRNRDDLWDSNIATHRSQLEDLMRRFLEAVRVLDQSGSDSWKIAVIDAGHRGTGERKTWETSIQIINNVSQLASESAEVLLKHHVDSAKTLSLEEQGTIIGEILDHLEEAAGISRWQMLRHTTWKKLVTEAKVNGKNPQSKEQFVALNEHIKLQVARQELVARWQRQMFTVGLPSATDFVESPEVTCQQYCAAIQHSLDWYPNIWKNIENEFESCGFKWNRFFQEIPPNLNKYGSLLRIQEATLRLTELFQSRIDQILSEEIIQTLQKLESALNSVSSRGSFEGSIVNYLILAVSGKNISQYQNAYDRIVDLQNRNQSLFRKRELLDRLAKVAPVWAQSISKRTMPGNSDNVIDDAENAWLWRQFNDELDRRCQTSIDLLQENIESALRELQVVTVKLIDSNAWAAQINRTSLEQRLALVGWLKTRKSIGRGTGKRAPRLQTEAKKLMEKSRASVPVWIMPLSSVAENFRPSAGLFDLVIIDEASQCDVMGLIACYMGKRVLIVGDDEQVSPEAVGEKIEETQHLIDEHLQGIPNSQLYDGKMSIYDLGLASFKGSLCLKEHFRCVPEIIQFSHYLCYRDKGIRPLRDPSDVETLPYVVPFRVEGSSRDGKINLAEAETIVSLIMATMEQQEYREQTFGVISLVGEEQARKIDEMLRMYLTPADYIKRQILCGNSAQFQGDERDIMFLSVVDVPQDGPLALRQTDSFRKRFNVAASRARNQMWVVHSLQPEINLKSGDLRRRLIEHAINPNAILEALEEEDVRIESEFERLVRRHLIALGYTVTPQWKVGYYRIDLVVTGNGKRLAIECDGDRWHPEEKLKDDMERQAILERLGWRFVRLRGSEFFRDQNRAIKKVIDRLTDVGIEPEAPELQVPILAGGELLDLVTRRAEEIRRAWRPEETDQDPSIPGSDAETSAVENKMIEPDELYSHQD